MQRRGIPQGLASLYLGMPNLSWLLVWLLLALYNRIKYKLSESAITGCPRTNAHVMYNLEEEEWAWDGVTLASQRRWPASMLLLATALTTGGDQRTVVACICRSCMRELKAVLLLHVLVLMLIERMGAPLAIWPDTRIVDAAAGCFANDSEKEPKEEGDTLSALKGRDDLSIGVEFCKSKKMCVVDLLMSCGGGSNGHNKI